ncbi:MAG TPA: PDZ domain-containing protein [Terriglobia bacterium]|nr:PDZ domain-containing protein [Terriglobia bacterium]
MNNAVPFIRRRSTTACLAVAVAGLVVFAGLAGLGQQTPPAKQPAVPPAQTANPPAPFKRIAYRLSMPQPASHLFHVSIDVEVPAGAAPATVDFQMPRWQPGRYSIGDFAANVQEFSARAGASPLAFAKADDQTWRVSTRGARAFNVTYKVFGNDLSGTFAQLDVTHASYTGGELFMYVPNHKQDSVELHVDAPPGWRVVNGRTETPDQRDWKYPNYEILIDNPTEVGPNWTLDTFRVDGKNYRVVVHSRAGEGGRRAELVRNLEKIVHAEVAMWGPPEFETYTFMIHYAADNDSWDGMEHLVSTQIILPGALADSGALDNTLETAAHEFFHVWNVKRLRPVEFGPWDWTRPAQTRSLWIAEGLTNYYGHVMLQRAGIWGEERLLDELSVIISNVENAPGSKLMSPVDASLAAPFIDAAVHRQRTNLDNTSITYYYRGEIVGLVLDLLIRGKSGGKRSLDDVLKRMYDEFYVKSPNATYYLKGRGYTDEDFVRVLSAVAGEDMKGFYDRHIRGVEPLPFNEALRYVGLQLVKTPGRGGFTGGIVLDSEDRQSLRLGLIHNNSPAERAGLQQGDVITSIGGVSVGRSAWRAALNRYRPGDRAPIEVQRFRQTVQVTMEIGEPEDFDYSIESLPNPSSDARALRAAWLSGQR